MEIISFRKIEGPNVYHEKPVLIMRLDLKEWAEVGSHEVPELQQKLLSLLPGLRDHGCSVGRPGGFLERLERGTYMAHIVEHVALELSCRSGIQVSFGKARFAGHKGLYDVITRFKSEENMKECMRQAVILVEACLRGQNYNIRLGLESILQKKDSGELGPTSQALVAAAQKRNIPVRRLSDETSLLQLGYGKNRRLLQTSMTDQTSVIGTDLVQDKQMTKTFLQRYGIPVPKGKIVSRAEELPEVLVEMPGPFVLKPLDGHHGEGVSLNLHTLSELESSFRRAQDASKNGLVLMEEMCEGADYRLLVVAGKFVAAARRSPPTIVGDGVSTIESLIETLNQDPRRGDGHDSLLTKVKIDESVLQHLHKCGRNLQTIPMKSEAVTLLGTANLSKGGTATDVTDEVHEDTRRLCERISRLVQLDICGIDLIHEDIRNPPSTRLKVIEVNAAPGLRMHISPCSGKPRDVAEPILEMLYPEHGPSRIPIISITGTNGKTTVARLLKRILSNSQLQVGLTTTEGIWIGDHKIVSGDTTGPRSAETVLADSSVQAAVLEVARGGILRGGLAYDWSDVGLILNVRPDHLGQDGLETLEDIVWVKSLVAERVRPHGTLVLNADDPASLGIRELANVQRRPRNLFLYSREASQKAFQEHLSKGGSGCWTDSNWIYLQQGHTIRTVMGLHEIPLTVQGTLDYQVSNVLAAIAGAISLLISALDNQHYLAV
ncbi:MAG: cyanophycin synthetase [Bdellovibrionales bacterium]